MNTNKVNIENKAREKSFVLTEFIALSDEERYTLIEKSLDEMYEGNVVVTKSMVERSIKLSGAPKDDYFVLSNNLVVSKDSEFLNMRFEERKSNSVLFLLLIFLFLSGVAATTYAGFKYYEKVNGESSGDIDNGLSNEGMGDNTDITSAELTINYVEGKELVVTGLFPDDQDGVEFYYPTKTLIITNNSDYDVTYKMATEVYLNTYESENFEYKIESTNGGYSTDFVMVPKATEVIDGAVVIPANTVQEYKITFRIKGLEEEQNYDQGKAFKGYIKIGD